MKRVFLIFLSIGVVANDLILPEQDLYFTKYKDSEYIYSKEINISQIANLQSSIIDRYTNEFGFNLDDTLSITISSNQDQRANGISTQIPLNSQFLYIGGGADMDYFCSSSWIKNLLTHETAHNFQLNPKENIVSKTAHKIFKNNPFTYIGLFPIFPIPNIMINSFLLEGNSVLNESRFGNGGRLYSGYALAELIELSKANKIRPELMYNSTLYFPYGEKNYLIGGFFQKFLAEKYGIDRVNGFFKTYSKQIIPLSVNSTFKKQFGKDFETLLEEFTRDINSRYKEYKRAKGKLLIKSQIFVPMNRDRGDILFLVGNFRDYPNLAIFDGKNLKLKRGSFKSGKPFRVDGKYYTKSVTYTSSKEIKHGLFDENGDIKEETKGRAVEGFLPDGKVVYFDILKSIDTPHIYIDGKFYDTANSSVFIDKSGNLYYFKQKGIEKTLYKNRKALFSYRGYYGFVVDVKKDNIYFIAPTKNGSGVYMFDGKGIKRAILGDNIIDFKLINSKEALINTINHNGYEYKIAKVAPISSKIPEVKEIKFKKSIKIDRDLKLDSKEYNPITNLKYSSFNQFFGFDSDSELFFNLNLNFIDPTTYNSSTLTLFRDNTKIVGGVGYQNSKNILEFDGAVYGADYDNGENSFGYRLNLELPLAKRGYYGANLGLSYTKEYDSLQRPASLYLNLIDSRTFGISKYPSSLNSLNIFIADDRDNFLYGFDYTKFHQFGDQNFVGFNLKSINGTKLNPKRAKGVKLDSSIDSLSQNPIEVEVLNLDRNFYVKSLTSFEIGLYKSFDTPLYYFSFPLSLKRTTLYSKYRRFNLKNFTQTTLGLESDIVFFNNFTLPIKFEYINTPYSSDDYMLRAVVGIEY